MSAPAKLAEPSIEEASAHRANVQKRTITYDDQIARWFVFASVAWGIVAMLAGAFAALELAFFKANVLPILSYGRLRPLHTNAAIFAFVGNMMFAGVYYSTQRLVKATLASKLLGRIHFWGWQGIIVAAAVTLPLGITQAKEYAELEWPIDLAIAAIWIVFAVNFFWTLAKRAEKQLYVAIWFYIATIVTVAVLHVVNALSIPVSFLKSYSVFGGAQDALVQWWYGHNAVAFFLTTPILGIMYYFLPKAAERPVYSYRLSIIHFWALVFVYIWAGPHHLLNTALPDWAQTLGMLFSLMLWAPSWGGMLNGLLTLRGAWGKVREDPVLKFFAAGVTFYGMATFEGPLLSIKSVSSLAHYTDWIVGHVHGGALGWNGFMAAGMFYWMVPRLFGTKLHSRRAAEIHFYIGTVGILLYIIAMWVSGITQGMMWRAVDAQGNLMYPSFVETLLAIRPMYWMRLFGGTLYLAGMVMMGWNLYMTAKSGKATDGEAEVVVEVEPAKEIDWKRIVFGPPVVIAAVCLVLLFAIAFTNPVGTAGLLLLAGIVGFTGIFVLTLGKSPDKPTWHAILEGRALLFTVLTVLAVLIGGVAEIVPSIVLRQTDAEIAKKTNAPYRALELEGRDVYIKEGCYTCHSQMIRPFRFETSRYGEVSTLDDSRWDHPFQWGSKRTGPDLARLGGKYPNAWHWQHMLDPRSVSPGSNMPSYAHLEHGRVDFAGIENKLRAMRSLGVPYTPDEIAGAPVDAEKQAAEIVRDLETQGIAANPSSELVAITAYLQRIGKNPPPPPPPAAPVPVTMTDEKAR
ncbi:cytochrome-c oxidase, cbb3-type subunit I [Polyangium sp. y55x31]|uniref:cytochrome-c oxidase, cbb3-type subunit I n=1 Tax=Polyangium sp. y55x31 TaxID=3042688 RepID=UPI002482E2E2|nr:cytochrome-c oxidase, cbb3-type subunit I [Polyangium sp. y55x31]MDI1475942.1 cytochrome-c oxidase, cbb3-type subunit I [Polyangium sp. y55x31]